MKPLRVCLEVVQDKRNGCDLIDDSATWCFAPFDSCQHRSAEKCELFYKRQDVFGFRIAKHTEDRS